MYTYVSIIILRQMIPIPSSQPPTLGSHKGAIGGCASNQFSME